MVHLHNFSVDQCLKCSTCNTVCPVYAVNEKYPGPKFLGPETARLKKSKPVAHAAADYCTGCRQCELVCPNGVPITHLAQEAKNWGKKQKGIPLRDWILGHNQWVSSLASRVAPLTNLVLGLKLVRRLGERTLGLKNRPFPTYHRPFSFRHKGVRNAERKVAFFTGCYGRYNGTGVAQSVVSVLEKCGVEVVVPPQKCCGVPMLSNGLIEEAKNNAVFNLKVLHELVEQGFQVVTSCPSCALSLKHDYALHFNLPQAAQVAAHVYDISEFLWHHGLLQEQELKPLKKRFFYHQPCHTKAQGMGSPAKDLLSLIPELELAVREQKCCGQAGTYGFKKEKYDTSWAIASPLFQDVAACRVEGIVTECGMCSLQLAHGTGKNVFHPMEILDQSLKG